MAVVLGQSGQAGRGRRARCGRGASSSFDRSLTRHGSADHAGARPSRSSGRPGNASLGSNGEPASEGRISYLKRGFGWDRSNPGTFGAVDAGTAAEHFGGCCQTRCLFADQGRQRRGAAGQPPCSTLRGWISSQRRVHFIPGRQFVPMQP